jgi:hypothetical protein
VSRLDLHDVEPERRAGVAEDHARAIRRQWQRDHRQPPTLTPREALAALRYEALHVWVAAHNVARGVVLSDVDLARLTVAARWIERIAQEAGV